MRIMIKIKNLIVILMTIAACGCVFNDSCEAYANAPRLTYEQLTRQYPSMESYVTTARKEIKNNWYPPVSSFENAATLILTIDKDGKLINASIVKSSNNDGFDNSLIEAAKKVKYSPLPEEVKQDCVDIEMEFNMQRRHISK